MDDNDIIIYEIYKKICQSSRQKNRIEKYFIMTCRVCTVIIPEQYLQDTKTLSFSLPSLPSSL